MAVQHDGERIARGVSFDSGLGRSAAGEGGADGVVMVEHQRKPVSSLGGGAGLFRRRLARIFVRLRADGGERLVDEGHQTSRERRFKSRAELSVPTVQ